MTRHLQACPRRRERTATAGSGGSQSLLHLRIADTYSGRYWLHLEMVASARLEALDEYLRAIWLECCGHLSQFTIGNPWGGNEVPPGRRAGDMLSLDRGLSHIYDFGTPTGTTIKVVDERSGPATTGHPIALMARNEPPDIPCMECDEPASAICLECVYEEALDGTLCDAHANGHAHDDYGPPLPVVNSPRMGMCGYTGPADPPY